MNNSNDIGKTINIIQHLGTAEAEEKDAAHDFERSMKGLCNMYDGL